jgi:hypothetical protein
LYLEVHYTEMSCAQFYCIMTEMRLINLSLDFQTYFCIIYIIVNCCSVEKEQILAMDHGQIDSVITFSSSSFLMTASH